MITAELKRIIANQREELNIIMSESDLIERDVPDLGRYLSKPNILAILGVRRCGKSILANQLFQGKNYAYVNFDDERLVDIKPENLEMLMESIYEVYDEDVKHLVFDEIQNVPRWELFINRLRRTKRIIITGSNANLLSSELSTHLTGRYFDHTLFPLSFKEYLKLIGIKKIETKTAKEAAKAKKHLERYMENGGLPESTTISPNIVLRVYQDIILKDTVIRYGIRHRKTFGEMAKFIVSNYSCENTYTNLKKITSIKNVHTVKNYVDYLCSVNLIFYLEKYSPKLKVQMLSPKKFYCVDTGIANTIGFRTSRNLGPLMENLVAIELLRRSKNAHDQTEVYYWKDGTGEVDFVIKKGPNVQQLIQSSYDLSKPDTLIRETDSLLKASDELDCKDLLIITWDQEDVKTLDNKKIKLMPLYKWLLTV